MKRPTQDERQVDQGEDLPTTAELQEIEAELPSIEAAAAAANQSISEQPRPGRVTIPPNARGGCFLRSFSLLGFHNTPGGIVGRGRAPGRWVSRAGAGCGFRGDR